jgi:hypothetical protein
MKTFCLQLIYRLTLTVAFFLILAPSPTMAIYNPLSVVNNRIGIHILDPGELGLAAKIVNAGGDWGYVTIPIQTWDRSRRKWQAFFDDCKRLHIIPILRLATEPIGAVWRKPTADEVLDFANFLNDLDWPIANRYVVVFNEPNQGQEWGGEVNPEEYATLLRFTAETLKSLSGDFFVLPAGLDAAAPNGEATMSSQRFIVRMSLFDPDIWSVIDGWTSHSYPNPDFAGRPTDTSKASIVGFLWELTYIRPYLPVNKVLPVFITETGWQHQDISLQTVAEFNKMAFVGPWNDGEVVAVTPFVLSANDGPFVRFSYLDHGKETVVSDALKVIPKNRGQPLMATGSSQLTIDSSLSLPAPTQAAVKKGDTLFDYLQFKY